MQWAPVRGVKDGEHSERCFLSMFNSSGAEWGYAGLNLPACLDYTDADGRSFTINAVPHCLVGACLETVGTDDYTVMILAYGQTTMAVANISGNVATGDPLTLCAVLPFTMALHTPCPEIAHAISLGMVSDGGPAIGVVPVFLRLL